MTTPAELEKRAAAFSAPRQPSPNFWPLTGWWTHRCVGIRSGEPCVGCAWAGPSFGEHARAGAIFAARGRGPPPGLQLPLQPFLVGPETDEGGDDE